MGTVFVSHNMKNFVALATVIAMTSARPRFLVIPIEDVDFGSSNIAHSFPVTECLPLQGRPETLKMKTPTRLLQDLFKGNMSQRLLPAMPTLLLHQLDQTMLTTEPTPAVMALLDGTPT